MLSDDDSVKLMKGKSRPIISANQRAEMLRGISVVDEVIVHRQNQFISLLAAIRPAIFFKGEEYGIISNEIKKNVGKVMNVGGQTAISTTELINRFQNRFENIHYHHLSKIKKIIKSFFNYMTSRF